MPPCNCCRFVYPMSSCGIWKLLDSPPQVLAETRELKRDSKSFCSVNILSEQPNGGVATESTVCQHGLTWLLLSPAHLIFAMDDSSAFLSPLKTETICPLKELL